MGKQQLEHSLPALIQSMLWHFQQAWVSRRPSIKQPSCTVLMAASETAATITVLPAPQESQPNYEEVPHGAKGNFALFPVSKFPAPREKPFSLVISPLTSRTWEEDEGEIMWDFPHVQLFVQPLPQGPFGKKLDFTWFMAKMEIQQKLK